MDHTKRDQSSSWKLAAGIADAVGVAAGLTPVPFFTLGRLAWQVLTERQEAQARWVAEQARARQAAERRRRHRRAIVRGSAAALATGLGWVLSPQLRRRTLATGLSWALRARLR